MLVRWRCTLYRPEPLTDARRFCVSRHSVWSPVSAVTGRRLALGLGSSCQTEEPAMSKTLLVALAIVCLSNGLLTSTSHSSTPKPTVASVIVSCTIHGC